MNNHNTLQCPECQAERPGAHPFCTECGTLLPALLLKGDVSVILGDVPSQDLREKTVKLLENWFPRIDGLQAEQRLRRGRSVLVSGLDEGSARRIVDALKRFRATATMERDPDWKRGFLNGGLAVSAIALLAGILSGPIGLILGVAVAIAAPVIGARIKLRNMTPLVKGLPPGSEAEKWATVAGAYSEAVRNADEETRRLLSKVGASVLDVEAGLGRDSIVATAAGEKQGALYERLRDSLNTAVDLSLAIGSSEGERRSELIKELEGLAELVQDTRAWFNRLESEDIATTSELGADLNRITASIDRIVDDARVYEKDFRTRSEKTPL